MNEIYIIISNLYNDFKTMAYGLTTDENDIDDAVQELMLYFLSMNKTTLENIYNKDGEKGLLNYGAVALKRSLTSPRSKFYYKYKKYYTNLNSFYTTDITYGSTKINNIPYEESDNLVELEKLEAIDKELNKLHWYDKKIFELYYYESNTLDSLAKCTKIGRNSLFTTIDKVRDILKKELNE